MQTDTPSPGQINVDWFQVRKYNDPSFVNRQAVSFLLAHREASAPMFKKHPKTHWDKQGLSK